MFSTRIFNAYCENEIKILKFDNRDSKKFHSFTYNENRTEDFAADIMACVHHMRMT